jgi:hypothetical protein
MIKVIELSDSKLELRSYDINVPSSGALVNVAGLTTDNEHDAILGMFLFDESYKGDAATLDTKSRISLEINSEEVVDNAHACMFQKSPNISLEESIFKTNIPVKQSNIKPKFQDGGVAGTYPKIVTLYLVCRKKQK